MEIFNFITNIVIILYFIKNWIDNNFRVEVRTSDFLVEIWKYDWKSETGSKSHRVWSFYAR